MRKDITIRYDNDLTSLSPLLISFAFGFSQPFFFFVFCMLPSFLQHEATCPRIQREKIGTGMRENGYINNIMTSNIISTPKSGIIMTKQKLQVCKGNLHTSATSAPR